MQESQANVGQSHATHMRHRRPELATATAGDHPTAAFVIRHAQPSDPRYNGPGQSSGTCHAFVPSMRIHLVSLLTCLAATSFIGTAQGHICEDSPDFAPDEAGLFSTAVTGQASLGTTRTIQFADVNGDQQDDLCYAWGADVTCVFNSHLTEEEPCWGFGEGQTTIHFPFSITSLPQYYSTLSFPDLDDDGLADACVRGPNGVYCARSLGTAFTTPSPWAPAFSDAGGWAAPQYYTTLAYPDVNGDDKADLCARGAAGVWCAQSTGASFSSPTLWSQNNPVGGNNDFSNAGGWASDPAYYSTIQFADIDGDGDDDVCGRSSLGLACSLSDHILRKFEPSTIWSSHYSNGNGWLTPDYYGTIQFGDINGDGMDDVCGRDDDGIHCGISYGAPSELFAEASTLDVPEFSDAGGWTPQRYYQTITLADVDGDGNEDVCGRGYDGIYCARATSYAQGFASGWTDLFHPGELWVDQFGTVDGWDASEGYWGTVQAADVASSWPGAEFCGAGQAGIWCSYN